MIDFRCGIGFDVHAFAPHRKLILGGVEIEYEFGLEGHSDADVLIHAIIDALLGAAGLGDIGQHFPDSDERYLNISSLALLKETTEKIKADGWSISNIDVTVIAETPKLTDYISKIKASLSNIDGIENSAVNIKATTTEKLGFTGRKEGIATMAVASLYKD